MQAVGTCNLLSLIPLYAWYGSSSRAIKFPLISFHLVVISFHLVQDWSVNSSILTMYESKKSLRHQLYLTLMYWVRWRLTIHSFRRGISASAFFLLNYRWSTKIPSDSNWLELTLILISLYTHWKSALPVISKLARKRQQSFSHWVLQMSFHSGFQTYYMTTELTGLWRFQSWIISLIQYLIVTPLWSYILLLTDF